MRLTDGQKKARDALIAQIEGEHGQLDWTYKKWFGGSARADLPGGHWVSVMVEPPAGTDHVKYSEGYSPQDLIAAPFKAVAPWMTMTEVGAVWHTDDPIPQELAEALCIRAGQVMRSMRWALGDLLNHLEHQHGETYAHYAGLTGLAVETLKQYKRVSAAIPYHERDNAIEWSYWQRLAALPAPDRKELADRVRSGEIEDVNELGHEVRARTGENVQTLPPCPMCGSNRINATRCKECGLDFEKAVWWLVDIEKQIGPLPGNKKRV
jgi:hypothetical protein